MSARFHPGPGGILIRYPAVIVAFSVIVGASALAPSVLAQEQRVEVFEECFASVNPTGDAGCEGTAISGTGEAQGGDTAISGTDDATCRDAFAACYLVLSGTGDASCYGDYCVVVSGSGDAGGEALLLGVSGTGQAAGIVAVAGTGSAAAEEGAAVSLVGDADCRGDFQCVSASGTGTADCDAWLYSCVAVSLIDDTTCTTSSGSACIAVSGSGSSSSHAPTAQDPAGGLAVAGTGHADGDTVASGTGDATACGDPRTTFIRVKCIALSGTGDATGDVAISGTGDAEGNVAASGTGTAEGDVALSGCAVVDSATGSSVLCTDPALGEDAAVQVVADALEATGADVHRLLETSLAG